MINMDALGWFAGHAAVRTEGYALLASLLRQAPCENVLETLGDLGWDDTLPEAVERAIAALSQAARDYPLAEVEGEFNRLFAGLGSGELVPYASWYRERKIQSAPLASLRSDLRELGIVRQADCPEPEDHAGALCEVMSLISRKPDGAPAGVQARFFHRHVSPWMMKFFSDLQSAKNAGFYRLVGLFGSSFLAADSQYLEPGSETPPSQREGGSNDEQRTVQ